MTKRGGEERGKETEASEWKKKIEEVNEGREKGGTLRQKAERGVRTEGGERKDLDSQIVR